MFATIAASPYPSYSQSNHNNANGQAGSDDPHEVIIHIAPTAVAANLPARANAPVAALIPAPVPANAPAQSYLNRFATTTAGEFIADEGFKRATGFVTFLGTCVFGAGAYTEDVTGTAAVIGFSAAFVGFSGWVVSTALSASTRPQGESLCQHIASSGKAGMIGLCAVAMCLGGRG